MDKRIIIIVVIAAVLLYLCRQKDVVEAIDPEEVSAEVPPEVPPEVSAEVLPEVSAGQGDISIDKLWINEGGFVHECTPQENCDENGDVCINGSNKLTCNSVTSNKHYLDGDEVRDCLQQTGCANSDGTC